jgi:hypothetical protein
MTRQSFLGTLAGMYASGYTKIVVPVPHISA